MMALQYRKSVSRYALFKLLGPRFPRLYTSSLSPVALRDIAEPKLPTPQWARIAPSLAGICGSDLATICAKSSPYLAPVTSMPFVLGHEVVGRVVEVGGEVDTFAPGDRVVLHPALGCRVRGIEPPCDACRDHREALCRNVTRGCISEGIQTGFCRDTGGAFSENLVAHQSQLYRIPDEINDRAAVLIEPFSCALHAVLRAGTGPGSIRSPSAQPQETVLVIGCGAIGLLTIAALRALGCRARVVAVAKYDHQRRHAEALGADSILQASTSTQDRYKAWAQALDAEVLAPVLGKPTVIGGASTTFDCVASSQSIDDGLRFTKSSGTFVLVGMPGGNTVVDWTPLWFKELTLHATYAYGPEAHVVSRTVSPPQGKTTTAVQDTFDVAIELMRSWGPKLEKLVGPPHRLSDHRAALDSALHTGRSGVVKTVFEINRE